MCRAAVRSSQSQRSFVGSNNIYKNDSNGSPQVSVMVMNFMLMEHLKHLCVEYEKAVQIVRVCWLKPTQTACRRVFLGQRSWVYITPESFWMRLHVQESLGKVPSPGVGQVSPCVPLQHSKKTQLEVWKTTKWFILSHRVPIQLVKLMDASTWNPLESSMVRIHPPPVTLVLKQRSHRIGVTMRNRIGAHWHREVGIVTQPAAAGKNIKELTGTHPITRFIFQDPSQDLVKLHEHRLTLGTLGL